MNSIEIYHESQYTRHVSNNNNIKSNYPLSNIPPVNKYVIMI